jgi:hypothetical protein
MPHMPLAGAYRSDVGADYLAFHGSSALPPLQPYVQMTVTGPGTTAPLPVPPYPRSTRGTIMAGSTTSVEVTCDGGKKHHRQ